MALLPGTRVWLHDAISEAQGYCPSGVVTSMSPDGKLVDLRLDEGYSVIRPVEKVVVDERDPRMGR
jgi:hypothetical protein